MFCRYDFISCQADILKQLSIQSKLCKLANCRVMERVSPQKHDMSRLTLEGMAADVNCCCPDQYLHMGSRIDTLLTH